MQLQAHEVINSAAPPRANSFILKSSLKKIIFASTFSNVRFLFSGLRFNAWFSRLRCWPAFFDTKVFTYIFFLL